MSTITTIKEVITFNQKYQNAVVLDYGKNKLFYCILTENKMITCTFEQIGKYLVFNNFNIEIVENEDIEKLRQVQNNFINASIPTKYELENILRRLQKYLLKIRKNGRFEINNLINIFINKELKNGK